MALRRGFKKEANAIAQEVRKELRLSQTAPFNIWKLADHLAIPVIPLDQLSAEAPNAVKLFMGMEEGAFSAVTVFHGPARVIVHNNAHSRGRQSSDVAHELSHALLHHPPMPAFDHRGCRDWNDSLEEEANWLAGTLLIPELAALHIARTRLTIEDAAEIYAVSPKMVQYRLNVTAAYSRILRARAFGKTRKAR